MLAVLAPFATARAERIDGGTPDGGAGEAAVAAPPATPPAAPPGEVPPANDNAARPAASPGGPPVRGENVAPEVHVSGRAPRPLDHVPGTAAVVRKQDLQQLAPQGAGDVLRTVSGVNVAPEDGMGLRQNVGFRGLDPNRSRKTLILEDGLPVTLNPYGAPELYYGPAIERMERVEVIKGSGQILWGPQTVGGLVNYVTPDAPKEFGGVAELRYGSFDYLVARLGLGGTQGPVGWRLDVIHRRFGGPRRLDLALTDVSSKIRFQLTSASDLTLKLHFYDEASSATYLGPTTPQYQTDPTFNATALHDRMQVRRYAIAAIHRYAFGPRLSLATAGYAYETEREWRRQDYDRTDLGLDYERICDATARCGSRGDAGLAPDDLGGSVFLRRSAAHRNRHYQVAGVEPRLTWSWAAQRAVEGELIALVRLHYEHAQERVIVGSSPTGQSGDIHDEELRSGYALALAVQHRFTLWNRLRVVPAVRVENFWADRLVSRVPTTLADGRVVGTDVDARGDTFSWAFIPGLGLSVDATDALSFYGGVHRGYAPPRTKDAVTPTGQNLRLDPELSWNGELGGRLRVGRWLNLDVAGFLIEFENQIIPPIEIAGQVGGATLSSGHSRHAGAEASLTFDLASLLGRRDFSLPVMGSYTWLPMAAFIGGLHDGNRLPYAPEHMLYAQLRFNHRAGPSAQIGITWLSDQAADKENTAVASRDGLVGTIPGYALLDARVGYTYARWGLTAYVAGKNLTGQTQIASRTPAGIQPTGFRQVFGGLEWQF